MDNSVFISHRRSVSGFAARAVFQDLEAHGISAFLDVDSIHSGQFEKAILSQIEVRPYFVVILAPGSLERCNEPNDWLRREIEYAISLHRIIIPFLTSDFKFDAHYAKPYLTGELAKLAAYNGISVPLDFFPEAMTRLRERFLKPIELSSSTTTLDVQKSVDYILDQTRSKPPVRQDDLTALDYLARGFVRGDNSDEQIADYTRAIELSPELYDAFYNRGLIYYSRGDFERAEQDFSQAVKINSRFALAYNNRGAISLEKKQYTRAIADFNKALQLNKSYVEAYTNRATANLDLGNISLALKDAQKALDLDINWEPAYITRGNIRRQKGDYDGAIADYTTAHRLNPQRLLTFRGRGNARFDAGDIHGAIADYSTVIRSGEEDANIYYLRGTAYGSLFQFKQALDDLNRAINYDPLLLVAYNARASAKDALGDLDGSIADCTKAIEINPKYAPAYLGRGLSLLRKGDKKGCEDIRKLLRIAPNFPNVARLKALIKEQCE